MDNSDQVASITTLYRLGTPVVGVRRRNGHDAITTTTNEREAIKCCNEFGHSVAKKLGKLILVSATFKTQTTSTTKMK